MLQFDSGAIRSITEGKGRFELCSFWALRRLALHMENGCKSKYPPRNWEKGLPLSRYLDSAIRHIYMLLAGMDDEDHAAAVFWNMHGFLHTQEMIKMGKLPKELDDMPDYGDPDPMTKRLYPEEE